MLRNNELSIIKNLVEFISSDWLQLKKCIIQPNYGSFIKSRFLHYVFHVNQLTNVINVSFFSYSKYYSLKLFVSITRNDSMPTGIIDIKNFATIQYFIEIRSKSHSACTSKFLNWPITRSLTIDPYVTSVVLYLELQFGIIQIIRMK